MTCAQCNAARHKAKLDTRYRYKNKDTERRAERLRHLVASENLRKQRKSSKGK